MKKNVISIISIVLVVAVLATCLTAFVGCGESNGEGKYAGIKIGLICLHDESSTYDKNFIDAMKAVQAELGLTNDQVIIATDIAEGDECYQKAADLAEEGCNIIIADSFGHEDYMIQAAKDYPNTIFAHATGVKAAANADLPNFVNAFASIYEGRYLAGVVAGLKIKEMIENETVVNGIKVTAETAKVGYVGAFTYAEVVSGYSSWYLGVKSIVPSVTMQVTFTGSWYDVTAENTAANTLINNGAILVSQHADSMGAPNACEAKRVPNVSYNGSTQDACPNTFLVSSKINWGPYYKYLVECKVNGTTPKKDWVGTIQTDSVQLTPLGAVVADGTQAKLDEVKAALVNGSLHVFDTSKFTVEGKVLEGENVSNGYYHESEAQSAPSFSYVIDGISLLNTAY